MLQYGDARVEDKYIAAVTHSTVEYIPYIRNTNGMQPIPWLGLF